MTSPFSWSDTVKIAFISCFPFVKPAADEHEDQLHNPTINRIPRARPDELQGLLVDDLNSETLSLHLNPGRARNSKRKRTKKHRRITFFGYNLFGRPIQLSDEDDALYYRRDGSLTPNTNTTTHSTSTFDSDAAPLDSDAIAALSSSTAAQASVDMETQRLKEKEERRQRRREKKELKRLPESMAVQGIIGDGDVFEGFQGSGGLMAPPLRHSPIPNATSSGSDSQEEYGRFVAAPSQYVPQPEENHDDADLDGGVYAHRKRTVKGSHGGSDSRSRTSTSTADRGPPQVPINPNNGPVQSQPPTSYPQSGRKKMSSRTSATTGSLATSQSPSLPSPVSLAFSNEMVSPSTAEQGQGFFDADNSVNPSIYIKQPVEGFTTPTLGGEFPMTGFRGLTGVGAKRTGDLGAFLARRGDEDKIDGL